MRKGDYAGISEQVFPSIFDSLPLDVFMGGGVGIFDFSNISIKKRLFLFCSCCTAVFAVSRSIGFAWRKKTGHFWKQEGQTTGAVNAVSFAMFVVCSVGFCSVTDVR